jgi:hypothetical protein
MNRPTSYVGIHADIHGGMTDIGRMIRDAWVFGLLPETETCEGWDLPKFDTLYEQVHEAWEPYGHLVSRLPADIRARHERIYNEAVKRARELGWSPELDDDE